jgi:hypothetical protein
MQYDNTNSGILAANTRRECDNQPTHTGSINVDGVEYWLSAWVKEGKPGSKLDGKKYFSLSLTKKDAPAAQNTRSAPKSYDFDSEDIPF